MRRLFLVLLVSLIVPFSAQSAPREGQLFPILRTTVTIDTDTIRLGDIFENINPKQEHIVVASAPPPGRRIALDSSWLSSVARSAGVPWSPTTGYERVIVERAGILIKRNEIEARILETLIQHGLPPTSVIELAGSDIQMYAPTQGSTEIGVRDVLFDQPTRQFTVTVEIPANTPNAQKLRVSGRAYPMAEVPIALRSINRGEVIDEGDFEWQSIRGDISRQGYATAPDQVIGMAAKRGIKAGTPIRLLDLQPPVLVRKGGLVTIILKQGNMSLTAQGKSLDNGALGDTVRIVNSQSKRTIEATVDGPDRVSVMPVGRSTAN